MFEPNHESFTNQPGPEEALWRYMDLARYLSLIGNSAIHFARADLMADRWEGAYGEANRTADPSLYGNRASEVAEIRAQMWPVFRREVFLSCWHLSPVESAAMWDIYQRDGRGVVVLTDWQSLTTSLETVYPIFGARVAYVDYRTQIIDQRNFFNAFMHKRESFAHEQEVRLLVAPGRATSTEAPGSTAGAVMPQVIPVSADLRTLIKEVRVAPGVPNWIHSTVREVTARYGLDYPVRQSDLAHDPFV